MEHSCFATFAYHEAQTDEKGEIIRGTKPDKFIHITEERNYRVIDVGILFRLSKLQPPHLFPNPYK